MREIIGNLAIAVIVAAIGIAIFTGSRKQSFEVVSYALAGENTGGFDHSHSVYDSLLKKYVRSARVDYKGFIASSEEFGKYLKQLGSAREGDYTSWSREQKLAFWINAYNAFTIKAIMDNYPIKGSVFSIYPKNSIRRIDGVWDELQFQAVGKMITLEGIEHGILRKEFDEPRIHAAIVCASIGCPDLRNEAYKAEVINEQLESAAKGFVNNPDKGVRINSADKTVKLAKIFNWFGEDFVGKFGNTELFKGRSKEEIAVLDFVIKHLESEQESKFLENNQFNISYLGYDWSLNELRN